MFSINDSLYISPTKASQIRNKNKKACSNAYLQLAFVIYKFLVSWSKLFSRASALKGKVEAESSEMLRLIRDTLGVNLVKSGKMHCI